MYWRFSDQLCLTGACLMYLLHNALINTVGSISRQFIIPPISELHWALHDIMILPENTNNIEAQILTRDGAVVIAKINTSIQTGFRLHNVTLAHDYSSGLQIHVKYKATVVVELPSGLLHILSNENYATDVNTLFIPKSPDDFNTLHMIVLSSKPDNVSVLICEWNYANERMNMTTVPTCNNKTVGQLKKVIFNCTSDVCGIEVESEDPVYIIEGRINHLTLLSSETFNSNLTTLDYISLTWSSAFSHKGWSNKYVFIPFVDDSDAKLILLSLHSTIVIIRSDGIYREVEIHKHQPKVISVSVYKRTAVTFSGNETFRLVDVYTTVGNYYGDIFPIPDSESYFPDKNTTVNESGHYQWIYIRNETNLVVICPSSINVQITSEDDTELFPGEILLIKELTSDLISVSYFNQLENGYYKMSTNDSFQICTEHYIDTHGIESRLNSQNTSNLTKDKINDTTNTGVRRNESVEEHPTNSDLPSTNISTSQYTSLTVSPNNSFMQNISASFPLLQMSSETTRNESFPASSDKQNKQENDSTVHGPKIKRKYATIEPQTSNPNERFKAVVDLFHLKEKSINALDTTSNNQNNPTYVYTVHSYQNEHADGKSPVAIIVSLTSALFAVGALLLGFMLKEVYSKRQQIRKARIRPFVSYY